MQDGVGQGGDDESQPSKGPPTASEQALDTIKEVEEEGEPEPLDTAQDAILARQLAEELEGGMYAKVSLLSQATFRSQGPLLMPCQQAWL